MFSRVLFPALMEAGAGKQNAVVVIVVRRYAGLVVVAGPGLRPSSIVTMMASGRDSPTCPSQEYSTPAFG
jgi:hypothetical protein